MDQDLPRAYVNKLRMKKWIIAAAGGALLIIVFLSLKQFVTPALHAERIRTSIAEIGSVESTLNASGIVIPEFEQVITSPIQSTVLSVNFMSGERIAAGEPLLVLDRESISNEYNKRVDEYDLKKNEIDKHKIFMEKTLSELTTNYDVKVLRVKYLETTLERELKLLEIGAGTKVDIERANLELEIAKKEIELLKLQISNQKKSLNADLKDLELKLRIQERQKNELKKKLDASYLKSELDGIVTWIKDEIGSNVTQGEVVAKIADLSSYKIEASISDIYSTRLFNGIKVRARVSNKDLTGTVINISPAVTDGVITFAVQLDNKTDSVLRPNLRVEVFVITSTLDDVVRVKNGPFFNASSDQKVFIVKNNMAVRVAAEFGASNFDFVQLVSGVNAGDEVIISNMEDYYHMNEIEIK